MRYLLNHSVTVFAVVSSLFALSVGVEQIDRINQYEIQRQVSE